MLSDLISRLRPDGTSSTAIAAAMDRARAAQADAESVVAAARQAWEAALLDADLKSLTELERKLGEAKTVAAATAARVTAVLSQLEARHAATKRSEVLGGLEKARDESEEAGRALVTWWVKNRAKIEAILQEGARLDKAWAAAQYEWQDADRAARAAYPDVAQQYPAATGNDASDWQQTVSGMTEPPRPARPALVPDAVELARQADLERRRAEAAEKAGPASGPGWQRIVGGAR